MTVLESGAKELGMLVVAIVVIVALIAIARAVFGENGVLKTKINEELNKVTSTEQTSCVPNQDNQINLGDGTIVLLNA